MTTRNHGRTPFHQTAAPGVTRFTEHVARLTTPIYREQIEDVIGPGVYARLKFIGVPPQQGIGVGTVLFIVDSEGYKHSYSIEALSARYTNPSTDPQSTRLESLDTLAAKALKATTLLVGPEDSGRVVAALLDFINAATRIPSSPLHEIAPQIIHDPVRPISIYTSDNRKIEIEIVLFARREPR